MEPGTAEDHATAEVPCVEPRVTAGEAIASFRGRAFADAGQVVVLDSGRLVGAVPVERLLEVPPDTRLGDLAEPIPRVRPEDDLELAAREAASNGGRGIAVVTADGRFAGIVPTSRLLRVLEHEHTEDLARIGGFLSSEAMARTAAEETLGRRLWHRLPWLALGLLGAMGSAVIVGWFEDELRDEVLLALFIPAVVYMADAVGTQTETLVIRGLAAGIQIRDVFFRELTTGLITGVLIGFAFFPFALVVWDDAAVAASVALALGVSCSVATLVAMTLPYLLSRLGRDPAYGSGPLATVVQDLLSVFVYFAIASALV